MSSLKRKLKTNIEPENVLAIVPETRDLLKSVDNDDDTTDEEDYYSDSDYEEENRDANDEQEEEDDEDDDEENEGEEIEDEEDGEIDLQDSEDDEDSGGGSQSENDLNTKTIETIKKKVQSKNKKLISATESKASSSNSETNPTTNGTKETTDEYADGDTSDEEDIRNTIGNVPKHWYNEYDHIGYDWDGKRIIKPPVGDELDQFLQKMEDPDFWRTVKDPQTGQDVIMCDADMDLIERLQKHKLPEPDFDEYAPWVDWFTSEVMQTPLRKFPEHKRSFIPSLVEKKKVSKIVHAIKMGWIKPKEKKTGPKFNMLWSTDDQSEPMRRLHNHIPAPKRTLPGHAESYNPPPEYLLDEREMKDWDKLKDTPWKRKLHFLPQRFDSLRKVPSYDRFIHERFNRCLDLYLCPRAFKNKLTIEPEDLVPKLPSPKDLQPFPTVQAIVYKGHTEMVRTISADLSGQFIASGSEDMTVRVWEISTGRCLRTIPVGGVVRCVSWCPNPALALIAVAADRKLLLINPKVGDQKVYERTDDILKEPPAEGEEIVVERVRTAVQWDQATSEEWENGIRIVLNHFKEIKQVTWHGRGDYLAAVMPEGQNRSVLIHQLSRRRSQVPFAKSKGLVQAVLFHPIRPFLFVATQRNVRIYDLAKQELVKKLLSNARWISSMAIHPGGDNLLVSTYDRKILWFDLDLSTTPYQTLRLHTNAVRGVAFHRRYPLFASGSDDRGVIVSHGMVYNDLLQNPLIVPLKRLCEHTAYNEFGILDVTFHPTQPWVFSAGADFTIRLYT